MPTANCNTQIRIYDWKQIVEEYENLDEDHPAYVFNGGKKVFYEDDSSGVYNDNGN